MKILKISRSILISLFLSFAGQAFSQELVITKEKAKEDINALSLGIDLAPFIIFAFEPERRGVSFIGRYLFKRNWFVVGEAGFENVNFSKSTYDYRSNGMFIKAGADYNFFKADEPGNNDNITVGLRYGFATQTQDCPSYTIFDDYWGNYNGSLGTSTVISNWLEIVGGIRTEVLKNFFMGWTFRMKILALASSRSVLEPYTISGYGSGDNNVNIGFTYTLEYQIPFKKK